MPTDIFAKVVIQEEPFRVNIEDFKIVATSTDPTSQVIISENNTIAVFRYESSTPVSMSVGFTAPTSVFTVSGSPITGQGVIALEFVNVAKNTVLAGKIDATGKPSFRLLGIADIPNLSSIYLPEVSHDGTLSGKGTVASPLLVVTGGAIGSVNSVAVSSFDLTVGGSPITNAGTITLAITDTGVDAGTYGSNTLIPVLSINAKGQIVGASSVPLADTGVVADFYTNANFTVNSQGQITFAENGTGGGGGGDFDSIVTSLGQVVVDSTNGNVVFI